MPAPGGLSCLGACFLAGLAWPYFHMYLFASTFLHVHSFSFGSFSFYNSDFAIFGTKSDKCIKSNKSGKSSKFDFSIFGTKSGKSSNDNKNSGETPVCTVYFAVIDNDGVMYDVKIGICRWCEIFTLCDGSLWSIVGE